MASDERTHFVKKVLIVSLLRLGDFIQHLQLIRSMGSNIADFEFTFLVNDEVKTDFAFGGLKVSIVKFPRKQIQEVMVRQENWSAILPILELNDFFAEIKKLQFSEIWDWSHTRVSFFLCGLLEVRVGRGGKFAMKDESARIRKWEKYFNLQWSEPGNGHFHYLDMLAKTSGLFELTSLKSSLTNGFKVPTRIGFQLFTSDAKKDWPIERYQELIALLSKAFPRIHLTIFVAPFEADRIENKFHSYDQLEVRILGLSDLSEGLSKVDLLVSADTSVLHLANLNNIPVLPIFLGSADVHKTSPRQTEQIVISGRADCYPCAHREPCKFTEPICNVDVTAQSVFEILSQFFCGDGGVRVATQQRLKVFRQVQSPFGLIHSEVISKSPTEAEIENEIRMMTWQFFLDDLHCEPVPPFGTAANWLMRKFSTVDHAVMVEFFALRGQQIEMSLELLEEFKSEMRGISTKSLDLNRKYSEISSTRVRQILQQAKMIRFGREYWNSVVNEFGKANGFSFKLIRGILDATKETLNLLKIDQRLNRLVLSELTTGGKNVIRTRKLPETRVNETRKGIPGDTQDKGL